jgi:hypothetical protein
MAAGVASATSMATASSKQYVRDRALAAMLEALESAGVPAIGIGDCLAPRTVEEAVLDGLVAASGL